jgi:hypothetical protein
MRTPAENKGVTTMLHHPAKSETEEKQNELFTALELNDLAEEVHPNTALLLRTCFLNRNIYETERLISVVNRAKDIAASRREAAVKEMK